MKIYYDNNADTNYLSGKTVAVLGYGSQGHAHALNLKESGVHVIVGLRKDSKSWKQAESDGLEVYSVSEASEKADVIVILLPDQFHNDVYQNEILPHLKEGKALGVAHGFSIHFNQITPPKNVDVYMVAPKGPGHLVRRVFQEGGGVPCLIAIHNDFSGKAKELALAHAKAIGSTRAGAIETTFKEETETDLFGEQTVLCGGVTELIKTGFEVLVEAGYQPEIAYFECLHELKLIVDLFYESGISGMYYSVSETAEYGGMTKGTEVIDANTKARMQEILKRVQDGSFADTWMKESKSGMRQLHVLREEHQNLLIEDVGKKLRKMMTWIQN